MSVQNVHLLVVQQGCGTKRNRIIDNENQAKFKTLDLSFVTSQNFCVRKGLGPKNRKSNVYISHVLLFSFRFENGP